ncbi:endonuclease/exonuclease/phosphatase family protein [Pigmentiphaga soli]|uniref:Endonuclease/exonuclease/phosphatase family protein n=1 Tax=Pigmentiphaga soli TaxID=1007095 RepID=A0ABP8H6P0_9BURK
MRIVNWNIQWGRGVDGRVDLARIVREARRVADFDVLCLQEISRGFDLADADGGLPGGPHGDQFAELASLLPCFAVIEAIGADLPPAGGGFVRRQFGNAIATRLPAGRVIRHTLPWPADPAQPSMQRVALEATIGTGPEAVRVIATHLEYYSASQRAAQIDALRAIHAEACGHAARPARAGKGPFAALARPAAAIVCGDFNTAFDSAHYRRMLDPIPDATDFVDAWRLTHPDAPRAPTVGLYDHQQWSERPFACDFMFVSVDLAPRVARCEVDAASNASDHQPVVLELR